MTLVFITYTRYFLLEIATGLEIERNHLKAWVKTLKDLFREPVPEYKCTRRWFYLGSSWNSGEFFSLIQTRLGSNSERRK